MGDDGPLDLDALFGGPPEGSHTPLHGVETAEGVLDCIEKGCDMDALDENGATPLLVACRGLNVGVAATLLELGADCTLANAQGLTPLHAVAAKGFVRLGKALLKAGADLNAADSAGWTPAHHAVAQGSALFFIWLMAEGCDLRAVNNAGEPPHEVLGGAAATNTTAVTLYRQLHIITRDYTQECFQRRRPPPTVNFMTAACIHGWLAPLTDFADALIPENYSEPIEAALQGALDALDAEYHRSVLPRIQVIEIMQARWRVAKGKPPALFMGPTGTYAVGPTWQERLVHCLSLRRFCRVRGPSEIDMPAEIVEPFAREIVLFL